MLDQACIGLCRGVSDTYLASAGTGESTQPHVSLQNAGNADYSTLCAINQQNSD